MNIPIDNVINLRKQGYSNNQIIEYLQHGGYNYTDIMDAFTQADIKGEVEHNTITNNTTQAENPMTFNTNSVVPKTNQPAAPSFPPAEAQPQQTQSTTATSTALNQEVLDEKIQEIVEAIIDERWTELEENISKIIEWKHQMTTKIEKVDQQFSDLKKNFDVLHESILGKVGEYDKHISNVGTEVKALEQVFQKILPGFIDNVNELSRISKNFKTAAASSKPSPKIKKVE